VEAGCQWLTTAIRRQSSGGSQFEASPGSSSGRPYREKTLHKKVLVEWLKLKALSSSSRTTKQNKTKTNQKCGKGKHKD
jgi:hypothetical protein